MPQNKCSYASRSKIADTEALPVERMYLRVCVDATYTLDVAYQDLLLRVVISKVTECVRVGNIVLCAE